MFKYLCALLLSFTSCLSFGAKFVAGKDYELVKNLNALGTPKGAISVTEFFSFGCPWCAHLEPRLNKWVTTQGEKIFFRKVPVVFNKNWEFYAKAYYAAEALSLNSTLNPLLFKAILQDKQSLNSNEAMVNFFIKQGVEPSIAKSAFTTSPSIELSLKTSQTLMAGYRIAAVPAFIVNEAFKTDLQMARSEERLFEILDYLIEKSKTTRAIPPGKNG
jgi:thiol:disulfide interchange protein DsbA